MEEICLIICAFTLRRLLTYPSAYLLLFCSRYVCMLCVGKIYLSLCDAIVLIPFGLVHLYKSKHRT